VLVASLALAGCGQKGPLYLPDEDKTKKEEQKKVSSDPLFRWA